MGTAGGGGEESALQGARLGAVDRVTWMSKCPKEGKEGSNYAESWEKSLPGSGNHQCKGPEAACVEVEGSFRRQQTEIP